MWRHLRRRLGRFLPSFGRSTGAVPKAPPVSSTGRNNFLEEATAGLKPLKPPPPPPSPSSAATGDGSTSTTPTDTTSTEVTANGLDREDNTMTAEAYDKAIDAKLDELLNGGDEFEDEIVGSMRRQQKAQLDQLVQIDTTDLFSEVSFARC